MGFNNPRAEITLRKAFWFYGVCFLACLYFAAFIAVYTPWGKEFGIALPPAFLPVKIGLVTVACVWFIFRVYRVIAVAGNSYEGPRINVIAAKVFVLFLAMLILLLTPAVAMFFGISYFV